MGYVALYREWRPQQFIDIVGQEHISRTLQNAIKNNRIAHAYLFCGPRGTGKTTTAKVMSKALNCLQGPGVEPCNECENCKRVTEGTSLDVMEIDAASNRGIDEMRDLREKVRFSPTEGKYRIYIIDEVHMLTTEAFNALLKTLEEPPEHVIFVLATTEPHKIPLTILSRCQRFDFRPIVVADIVNRLKAVVDQLGIDSEEEALSLIARTAEGGMRDALSVLDQCISFGGSQVRVADVNDVLGTVNGEFMFNMAESFSAHDITLSLKLVDELVRQGKDVRQFTKDLTEFFRNLLLTEVCADVHELVPVTEEVLSRMKQLASRLGKNQIIAYIDVFSSVEREMKWTSQPRLILELAVIKTGEKTQTPDYEELNNRIIRIEELMVSGKASVSKGAVERPGQKPENNAAHKPVRASSRKPPEGNADTWVSAGKTEPDRNSSSKEAGQETGEGEYPVIAVDTETVRQCWNEILNRIKKVRMSARAFLLEGKPLEVDNNNLVLSFPQEYAFHKEKVEQPENRNAIESVVREVTGAELKLKCIFENQLPVDSATDNGQKTKDDPLLEKAIDLFGGDIIEIED